MSEPCILIVRERIDGRELQRLVRRFFQDMVKFVVDVRRNVMAVGGELHADAEALLLEQGSQQEDLWGGNYYPGRGRDGCIEYTALINIRPAQANPAMELQNLELRARMSDLVFSFLGEGEPLP